MKKLITEQNLKKDRRTAILISILIFLVAVLAVIRVVIANRLVDASEKLRTADRKIEAIKEANQNVFEALRQPQSITYVEEKAKTLGYTKAERLVFLSPQIQVALGSRNEISLR